MKTSTTTTTTKKNATRTPAAPAPTVAELTATPIAEAGSTAANPVNAAKAKEYQAKMRAMPAARRAEFQAANVAVRMTQLLAKLTSWDEPCLKAGEKARVAITDFVSELAKVPNTFEPVKHGGAKGLAVGTIVQVAPKALAKYEGILTQAELTGLTVRAVVKGKVRCETAAGAFIILPRGHVAPTAPTTASAS